MDENPYQSPAASLEGRDSYSAVAGKVSPRVLFLLGQIRPWALAVAIGSCLFVLIGVGGTIYDLIKISRSSDSFKGFSGLDWLGYVIGLAALALSVLMVVRLFQFAAGLAELKRTQSVVSMDDALERHRAYWLLQGIGIIASLVLIILGIVITFSVMG